MDFQFKLNTPVIDFDLPPRYVLEQLLLWLTRPPRRHLREDGELPVVWSVDALSLTGCHVFQGLHVTQHDNGVQDCCLHELNLRAVAFTEDGIVQTLSSV